MAQQVKEPAVFTAAAQVTDVAQVQSLAWELLHAAGMATKYIYIYWDQQPFWSSGTQV